MAEEIEEGGEKEEGEGGREESGGGGGYRVCRNFRDHLSLSKNIKCP